MTNKAVKEKVQPAIDEFRKEQKRLKALKHWAKKVAEELAA